MNTLSALPTKICPVAPAGAQAYADQLTGNVAWGVIALFAVAVLISIGAIVAGRIFSMPHASIGGVVGLAVTFFAAIGYMVVPGMVSGFLGSGCIG